MNILIRLAMGAFALLIGAVVVFFVYINVIASSAIEKESLAILSR